jgi:predicted metalloprotease with PDZ domain
MFRIKYKVELSNLSAHIFTVTIGITNPPSKCYLHLPNWIPGSYMIRDFVRNVIQVRMWNKQGDIDFHKKDKSIWFVETDEKELWVQYEVYAWDLSVRTAYLDSERGYFNGTSMFMYVDGFQNQPHYVEIIRPEGEHFLDWKLATTLSRVDSQQGMKAWDFGEFVAGDYDELVDHPVEMADFDIIEWDSHGIPHAMVLTGRYVADLPRLTLDLKIITDYVISFLGKPEDLKEYLFMTMVVGNGYGGLEHRASTSLLASRKSLPQVGVDAVKYHYRDFLGLCAHEYFHTWNVKRIKPERFIPYNFMKESPTTLLWVFEGFTSYYDDLILLRSGLTTPKDFLEVLGINTTRVHRIAGTHKQTLCESSYDAWVKLYRQDENAPNSQVSYYAKGALVALTLDLKLRLESKISLDDVMLALWERYGKQNIGVPERAVEELVMEMSGLDLQGFFDDNLRRVGFPPLSDLLEGFGVHMKTRTEIKNLDKGGAPSSIDREQSGDLGVRYAKGRIGVKLHWVYDGGVAQKCGLSAGDEIIAIDGIKVDASTIFQVVSQKGAGTEIEIHAFRRDELHTFTVVLQQPPKSIVYFEVDENTSQEKRERRKKWLQSASDM